MNDHLPIFETTRLIGRTWATELAADALEIYGDPDVTRFIGGQTIPNVEEMVVKINEIIKKYRSLPQGMGSFAVHLKTTGSLVGTAMIKPMPNPNGEFTTDIEVGWHLGKRQCGKGYATEWGQKLIEIGFNQFKLDQIHAVVDPGNEKSKKVAVRLGMRHLGLTREYYEGKPIDHYMMTRDEYFSSS